MTLKDFVHKLIEIQLGMIHIHISSFKHLRDKSSNYDYMTGVQDCIDIMEESLLTGMSITDEEIQQKERGLQAALEAILASRIPGEGEN